VAAFSTLRRLQALWEDRDHFSKIRKGKTSGIGDYLSFSPIGHFQRTEGLRLIKDMVFSTGQSGRNVSELINAVPRHSCDAGHSRSIGSTICRRNVEEIKIGDNTLVIWIGVLSCLLLIMPCGISSLNAYRLSGAKKQGFGSLSIKLDEDGATNDHSHKYIIHPNNIQLKAKIGSGATAVVYKGVYEGLDCAVKGYLLWMIPI